MTLPADDGRVSLSKLPDKWREDAESSEEAARITEPHNPDGAIEFDADAAALRTCADELAATLQGMTCATCVHQITEDQCGDGLEYALCDLLSGKAPLGPVRNVKCETLGNFCGAHHPAPPRADETR